MARKRTRQEPASEAPSRDSQERVTMSSIPVSAEARTSSHSVALGEVPPRWIDRLMVATCELPATEGEEAVARWMVEALADVLPDHAVGCCLVPGDGGPQQVIKVMPAGEQHRSDLVEPARLFPAYPNERVLDVETGGTTLHVASDDPIDDDSPVIHVLGRTALALNRGLALARAHAQAKAAATELRALNTHMVQAEKLASLGQIAAGVVHELNNPLTSILAYTQYLARKMTDPDATERLSRIQESASRMLKFTRDLVTYARPSSEAAVPVSIHTVIDQSIAFCEHILADVGATVDRRFGEGVPPVSGKPEQLTQVFVNLVTNACHAMPRGTGRLVITTSVQDSIVCVVVHDNGHGIARDHLPLVFAPFFTTKTEGRGTGLGLSIVKNIIDSHGGAIRVESETDDGARFVLMFKV
jgi:signal transduction histidine kinase